KASTATRQRIESKPTKASTTYLLASFAPSVDYARQFLMRMKRCRFLSENWYESGAQFIRVVTPATS
ncbi:MAG: hypothetical protein AAGF97_02165, partial [Planctomycetota bacterium]